MSCDRVRHRGAPRVFRAGQQLLHQRNGHDWIFALQGSGSLDRGNARRADDGVSSPAHASASGAQLVSAFNLPLTVSANGSVVGASTSLTLPIPAGWLNHTIVGDDRRIDREFAEYSPTLIGLAKNKVCNWRIDFLYRESGREYMRERGKVIHECGGIGNRVFGSARPKMLPRYGTACAQLWANGHMISTQCHNITR